LLSEPQEIDSQRQESNKYENTCRLFARQKTKSLHKAKGKAALRSLFDTSASLSSAHSAEHSFASPPCMRIKDESFSKP